MFITFTAICQLFRHVVPSSSSGHFFAQFAHTEPFFSSELFNWILISVSVNKGNDYPAPPRVNKNSGKVELQNRNITWLEFWC